MSAEVEMLLRRFAEDEDRLAPRVTAAEVMHGFERRNAPSDGSEVAVTPLLLQSTRWHRPFAVYATAAIVASAAIIALVLAATGGSPNRKVHVGGQPSASSMLASPAPTPVDRAERAKQFVSLLAADDYKGLTGFFTPSGRAQEELAVAWPTYTRAYGQYRRQGQPSEWPCTGSCTTPPGVGIYRIVDVPVDLSHSQVYVQLYFVPSGLIDFAVLVPPDAPPSALQGQLLQPGDVTGHGDPATIANTVVADLVVGRYQAIIDRYSPIAVAGAAPTITQLQRQWQTTVGPLGVLSATGRPGLTGSGLDGLVYTSDLTFSQDPTAGQNHVRININLDDKLRVQLVQIILVPPNGGPPSQTPTAP